MTPSIEVRFLVITILSNRISLLTKYFHIVKVVHSLVVAQLWKIVLCHPIYLIDLEQWSVETQYNILTRYEILVCDCTYPRKDYLKVIFCIRKIVTQKNPKVQEWSIFFQWILEIYFDYSQWYFINHFPSLHKFFPACTKFWVLWQIKKNFCSNER